MSRRGPRRRAARARGKRPAGAKARCRSTPHAAAASRPRRPGWLARRLLPPGLAHHLRAAPGLRVYLAGAGGIWLLTRTLVGHGVLAHAYGTWLLGLAQLLGLVAAATCFFGHTGQLAEGREDLRRLRTLLATHGPAEAPARRRLLAWALRVHHTHSTHTSTEEGGTA